MSHCRIPLPYEGHKLIFNRMAWWLSFVIALIGWLDLAFLFPKRLDFLRISTRINSLFRVIVVSFTIAACLLGSLLLYLWLERGSDLRELVDIRFHHLAEVAS